VEERHTLTPQGYFKGHAEQEGRIFQMGTGVQINADQVNLASFLEEASLQGLSTYRPVPVATVDPLSLGVHRSEANHSGTLPEYVTRNIDTELRSQVSHVRTHGGFILLVGDSTAGKTRSAFEAIRAVCPDGKLWVPVDGRDLVRNLRSAVEAQDGCFTWLDDLERYLGPDGLTPTVLAVIRQFKLRVVATMRAEQYRRLSPESKPELDGIDDHGHAALGSRVLEQVDTLILPRVWSGPEVERARNASDTRVAGAVAHSKVFGIAEYLAAGPRLYREWKLSGGPGNNPRGAALVAAATDIARAGLSDAIPLSILLTLHETYLEHAGGDLLRPESLEAAIEWATRRRFGVTSLLLPIKAGSYYRVFDYLPDALARSGDALPIPPETWKSALQHAVQADLSFHVGMAAIQYKEWEIAKQAWHADLEKHPIFARINLGRVHKKLDDKEGAKRWWREATNLGSVDAAIFLGSEYESEGRINEAIALYRIGADKNDNHAIRHLAYALPDERQSINWWLKIAQSDETGHAAYNLGCTYAAIRDQNNANKWWKIAAERGFSQAMNNYALSLIMEGRKEEGLQWMQQAADQENPKAMINLADHLSGQGKTEEAIALLKRAVDLGDPAAYNLLGHISISAGNEDRAVEYWRRGHEAGEPRNSFNLGRYLQRKGDLVQAKEVYRIASAAGEERAAFNYAFMLAEDGDTDEAEVHFRYALNIVTAENICDFGNALARQKKYEQALGWLNVALVRDHMHAGCLAGRICLYKGRHEDGIRLLQLALSDGHKHAGEFLASFLARAGMGTAAARVLRATNEKSAGRASKRTRSSTHKLRKRRRR
jgi:TPR repeat protein